MTWGKICYIGGIFTLSGTGSSLFSLGQFTPYCMYDVINPMCKIYIQGNSSVYLNVRYTSDYNIISCTGTDWWSTYSGSVLYFSMIFIMN